jgi:hypothetical protein
LGDFLEVYRAATTPAEIYGFPITDAFIDPETRKTVQYFEKARFVLDPNAPPALQVKFTQLGKLLYTPGDALHKPLGFSGCRQFPETGFEVCYDFLEFFEANGDLAQFGYPISNYEKHGDRIVQTFQLARFEWHPELRDSSRVKISNLGIEYFYFINENPKLLLPQLTNAITQTTMKINLRAYVGESFVPLDGYQKIFVLVHDQNRQPVSGAKVNVTMIYPDGRKLYYRLTETNDQGITSAEVPYTTTKPSNIALLVEATYNDLQNTTRTCFQTWY